MAGEIVPVSKDQPELTEREQFALKHHIEKRDPPISPYTAIKLFELFLAGKTCEDIRRLNPNFTLGQIVHARIDNEWDRRLKEHIESLYNNAAARISQVTLETALTLANLLSAKNKYYQDEVLLYLQTGKEEHLLKLGLGGLDGYKKLVEVMQKLTGTDNAKTVKGEITHTVKREEPQEVESTATQAEKILDALILEGTKSDQGTV